MNVRPMMRLVLALTAAVPPLAAQEPSTMPQRFTATAVSLGGPTSAAGTARVDITIERWSTPQERNDLIVALKEQGPEKLLDKLRSLKPVGRISTPGEVGHELRYASEERGNDGRRRIFIATDRPVGFWEAATQPRLSQYPFTFIELRLDSKGEGEGKLSLATQLNAGGNVIELVNYTQQPLALTAVRQESK
jgi:hypothetical protein